MCQCCGKVSDCTQVSPDYDASRHNEFVRNAVHVNYEYNDEIVDEFLLSPEFVKGSHAPGGTFPRPEDYPKWMAQVKVECKSCFDRRSTHSDKV